ncbi:hypothetical protein SAMN05421690_102434 [Nitrosomonas sp. Nm51]|nr:hypothetical protein SAMN05421690_102434 [Nitrosomonas sp. Nm51]
MFFLKKLVWDFGAIEYLDFKYRLVGDRSVSMFLLLRFI